MAGYGTWPGRTARIAVSNYASVTAAASVYAGPMSVQPYDPGIHVLFAAVEVQMRPVWVTFASFA